jgi:hypothetical protein
MIALSTLALTLQVVVFPLGVADIVAAARVADDPPIAEVQAAALRANHLSSDALDGLRGAASLKGALPMLEVSGGLSATRLDEDTVLDEYSATTPWVIRGASGNATEVRVKLSWDLSRIAYNAETLDVLALQAAQEELLTRVTRLYAKRRRLQLAVRDDNRSKDERIEAQIELDEATGLLSALTGGWFAAQLKAP